MFHLDMNQPLNKCHEYFATLENISKMTGNFYYLVLGITTGHPRVIE